MTKKYSLGWIIYSIMVFVITLGVCVYQKNSLLLVITTLTGIVYVLLNAKSNKYGFVFGMINLLLYGIILLNEKIYASAIYNLFYAFPMVIYGYVKYIKDEKQNNLGMKVLKKKTRIYITLILIFTIAITAYILNLIGGNLIIVDSIITILGIVAVYLLSNRYKEQWIVWIITNLTGTIMWIILTIQNTQKLPILIMWIVYLINSVYGLIHWEKIYKEKNKKV